MTDTPIPLAALDDRALVTEFQRTEGGEDKERADALLAEIAKRNLDF